MVLLTEHVICGQLSCLSCTDLTVVIQTLHSGGVTLTRDIVEHSHCWSLSLVDITQMMEQEQGVYAALVSTIHCSMLLTRKHVDDVEGNESW